MGVHPRRPGGALRGTVAGVRIVGNVLGVVGLEDGSHLAPGLLLDALARPGVERGEAGTHRLGGLLGELPVAVLVPGEALHEVLPGPAQPARRVVGIAPARQEHRDVDAHRQVLERAAGGALHPGVLDAHLPARLPVEAPPAEHGAAGLERGRQLPRRPSPHLVVLLLDAAQHEAPRGLLARRAGLGSEGGRGGGEQGGEERNEGAHRSEA